MTQDRLFRGAVLVVGTCLLMLTGQVVAYDQYSVNKDATNCRACHGDFRTNPYVEPDTMASWGDDAHDIHRNTMLSGDCDTCHGAGSRFPVLLDTSVGGVGLQAISCTGCHGRAADGTGNGTEGYGAGLRQHHWNINVTIGSTSTRVCADCHTDSDPANFTPAGEHVLPPYYSDVVHPAIPQDPCSYLVLNGEDFAGTVRGLDNDGDGLYDTNDTDCAPLSVFLEFFEAEVAGRSGVMLRWKTTAETDNAGFRLSRVRERKPPEVIGFIGGQGSDLFGADYEFLDDAHQTPGAVVYILEDIDIFGRSTRHGPARVLLPRAVGTPPGKARD